ncbi:MAG: hypothetical protein ACP5JW_03940 [Candidatus Bathyarchaeia archaeon]
MVAVLLRCGGNEKWVSRHYEELKKCVDEWVAVLNGTVVDHDVTWTSLLLEAFSKAGF